LSIRAASIQAETTLAIEVSDCNGRSTQSLSLFEKLRFNADSSQLYFNRWRQKQLRQVRVKIMAWKWL
jgi:hypothetical protein